MMNISTWINSNISVVNGSFNISQLNYSNSYRASIIGIAPTKKSSVPVYISLIMNIP